MRRNKRDHVTVLNCILIGAASSEAVALAGLVSLITGSIFTGNAVSVPGIIRHFMDLSPEIMILLVTGGAGLYLIGSGQTSHRLKLAGKWLILHTIIPLPIYIKAVTASYHIWIRITARGFTDPFELAVSLITVFGLLSLGIAQVFSSMWVLAARHLAALSQVQIDLLQPAAPTPRQAHDDYYHDMVRLNRHIIRTAAEAQKARKQRREQDR